MLTALPAVSDCASARHAITHFGHISPSFSAIDAGAAVAVTTAQHGARPPDRDDGDDRHGRGPFHRRGVPPIFHESQQHDMRMKKKSELASRRGLSGGRADKDGRRVSHAQHEPPAFAEPAFRHVRIARYQHAVSPSADIAATFHCRKHAL